MTLVKSLFLFLLGLFTTTPTRPEPTPTPPPAIISQAQLPDSYHLNTTFIPQAPEKNWDQPWQDACEEAALLTVDYFYRQLTPSTPELLTAYQSIFDYQDSQGWTKDVNLSQMSQIALNHFSYSPKIITNPTLTQLKQYLAQNIPIIVPANGKTLYRENKHFKNGGPWYHNLVILGYNDSTQKFIVHDVGTQFGAYFTYSYQLLLDSIHDFPDSGHKEDINSGPKKVLLLLQ